MIEQKFTPCGIFYQVLCAVSDALFTSNLIVMAKWTTSFCKEMMTLISCAAMCCDFRVDAPAFHLEFNTLIQVRRRKANAPDQLDFNSTDTVFNNVAWNFRDQLDFQYFGDGNVAWNFRRPA